MIFFKRRKEAIEKATRDAIQKELKEFLSMLRSKLATEIMFSYYHQLICQDKLPQCFPGKAERPPRDSEFISEELFYVFMELLMKAKEQNKMHLIEEILKPSPKEEDPEDVLP